MNVKAQFNSTLFRGAYRGAIFGVLLCISFAAHGDLLITRDGERLSGSLSRVVEGILVYRTALRGQMMLPMEEVQRLQTEERWIVTMNNGDVSIGRLVPEGMALDGATGEDPVIVPLAYRDVLEARQAPPLPKSPSRAWQDSALWKQNLSAGGQANPDGGDVVPYAQWEASHQNLRGSVGLRLRFDLPEEGQVADELRGDLNLTSPEIDDRATFIQLSVRRDREEALQWETGLTVGMRYSFSTTPEVDVFAYLGLGAYYSRWEAIEPGAGPWAEDAKDGVALRTHIGLGYRRPIWGDGEWSARVAFQPGISSFSRFRAEAETSVTYPLTNRLRLRFDMLMAYESDPVFETLDRLDTSLGAGIQLDF